MNILLDSITLVFFIAKEVPRDGLALNKDIYEKDTTQLVEKRSDFFPTEGSLKGIVHNFFRLAAPRREVKRGNR